MRRLIFLQCLAAVLHVFLMLLFPRITTTEGNNETYRNMRIRLNNGREIGGREGRVEISLDNGATWGTICSSRWSFREGNVVCRQLDLGYAAMANQSTEFGDSEENPWKLVGTLCRGTEKNLTQCFRESTYPRHCNQRNKNVANVRCVTRSPDLSLGLREIEQTAFLDAVPLSRLTCAMEENCLANDAYVIRPTQPDAIRLLLRFATKAENVGTADFSPYANYEQWQWHQCHRHYHSMENFASFDVYNLRYEKVAQGHKASFCLMDSMCVPGAQPTYTCGNHSQGISMGCADVYTPHLDCQWVDVTTLPKNQYYILRVALNPEYRIGEMSYENNGAECVLYYTGERSSTKITSCSNAPLWFRI